MVKERMGTVPYVETYLRIRRRWLRDFLDTSGLLVDARWFVVHRFITKGRFGDASSPGFTVNSVMILERPNYEKLKALLEAQRFLPVRNAIDSNGLGYRNWWRWLTVGERFRTKILFHGTGIAKAKIGYQIYVPVSLSITDQSIIDDVWAPVVRATPFRTLYRASRF